MFGNNVLKPRNSRNEGGAGENLPPSSEDFEHSGSSAELDQVLTQDQRTELSESVIDVSQITSLEPYLKRPQAGSILHALLLCKSKVDVENLVKKKVLPDLASAFIDESINLPAYVAALFVLNKRTAYELVTMPDNKEYLDSVDTFDFISQSYNVSFKKRSDVRALISKASVYHPGLAQKLTSMFPS